MQGFLEINYEWTDINSLVAKDVNGNVLDFSVSEGDTLNIVVKNTTTVMFYQGNKPLDGYDPAAVREVSFGENATYGIPAETVWVRGDNGTKIGFILIKG